MGTDTSMRSFQILYVRAILDQNLASTEIIYFTGSNVCTGLTECSLLLESGAQ